ncbi:MAG: FAD-dependent oxidoreductase, partial [Chthoniobacterales bacterium]
RQAGMRVILLERGQISEGETGHTTSHLTNILDMRQKEIISTFGEKYAQQIWAAGDAAIEQIKENVAAGNITCDLKEIPGYLISNMDATQDSDIESLKKEAQLVKDVCHASADYQESIPDLNCPGVHYPGQYKFHPYKYVSQLASKIPGNGCAVFEKSNVDSFDEKSRAVMANGYRVNFRYVFIATHVPLQGFVNTASAMLLQTKISGYSTYAVGGWLSPKTLQEALYWDAKDPYSYLRVDHHEKGDYIILGGEDHKTGQNADQSAQCYTNLESRIQKLFPKIKIADHWSGQVIETVDGMPYIGEVTEGQFIATGFSGNGITFGTLAAMMGLEVLLNGRSRWDPLFDIHRKKLAAIDDYIVENKDYPLYMAKGCLQHFNKIDPHTLKPGEVGVGNYGGKKVAAYRPEKGEHVILSAICPHMGCVVAWNGAEKTWDCPCHGSRFMSTGEVMAGPAESPLAKLPDSKG